MPVSDPERRSLLLTLGALGVSSVFPQRVAAGQVRQGKGYALGPGEGEHLVHFRDGGDIRIMLGAATGSDGLALGSQQVKTGTGIPIHRHLRMEEAFHVLEGNGTVILDDVRRPLTTGATVFIPKNTWHGFENPGHELLLLWIVSPAGLDGFFRETCSRPGESPKRLAREQLREIARKYDTEFR